jgi:hypothetical protein
MQVVDSDDRLAIEVDEDIAFAHTGFLRGTPVLHRHHNYTGLFWEIVEPYQARCTGAVWALMPISLRIN